MADTDPVHIQEAEVASRHLVDFVRGGRLSADIRALPAALALVRALAKVRSGAAEIAVGRAMNDIHDHTLLQDRPPSALDLADVYDAATDTDQREAAAAALESALNARAGWLTETLAECEIATARALLTRLVLSTVQDLVAHWGEAEASNFLILTIKRLRVLVGRPNGLTAYEIDMLANVRETTVGTTNPTPDR